MFELSVNNCKRFMCDLVSKAVSVICGRQSKSWVRYLSENLSTISCLINLKNNVGQFNKHKNVCNSSVYFHNLLVDIVKDY